VGASAVHRVFSHAQQEEDREETVAFVLFGLGGTQHARLLSHTLLPTQLCALCLLFCSSHRLAKKGAGYKYRLGLRNILDPALFQPSHALFPPPSLQTVRPDVPVASAS